MYLIVRSCLHVDYKPCMYAVGNTAHVHCIWEKTSDRIHVRCVIGKNCLATYDIMRI